MLKRIHRSPYILWLAVLAVVFICTACKGPEVEILDRPTVGEATQTEAFSQERAASLKTLVLDGSALQKDMLVQSLRDFKSPIPAYEVSKELLGDYRTFQDGPAEHPEDMRYFRSMAYLLREGREAIDAPYGALSPAIWSLEFLGMKSLGGVVLRGEELFLADPEGHAIHVFNLAGEKLRLLQSDAAGNPLFKRPMALFDDQRNGRFYVTEEGRVSVFNAAFELEARYDLPARVRAEHIAVDAAGDVYISRVSNTFPEQGLYRLEADGRWQSCGVFNGPVFVHQGSVFAAQAKEPISYDLRQGLVEEGTMNAYLYTLDNGKARIADAFPVFSSIGAAVSYGEGIYVLNAAYAAILNYKLAADEILMPAQNIAQKLPDLQGQWYAMAFGKDRLFLSQPQSDRLFVYELAGAKEVEQAPMAQERNTKPAEGQEVYAKISQMQSPMEGYEVLRDFREDYALFYKNAHILDHLGHAYGWYFLASDVPNRNAKKEPGPQHLHIQLMQMDFSDAMDMKIPGPEGIKSPKLLCGMGEAYVLFDAERVSLFKLAATGEILAEQRGEFVDIKALFFDAHTQTLLALDQGAGCIWRLDANLQTLERIALPEKGRECGSLAMDAEGMIYLAKETVVFPEAGLFSLDPEGRLKELGYFSGKLFAAKGEVYAANLKHPLAVHPEILAVVDSMLYSYLYRVDATGLHILDSFPNYFAPAALCYADGKLYAYSASLNRIYAFDFDAGRITLFGKGSARLESIDPYHYDTEISLARVGEEIFLAVRQAGQVFSYQEAVHGKKIGELAAAPDYRNYLAGPLGKQSSEFDWSVQELSKEEGPAVSRLFNQFKDKGMQLGGFQIYADAHGKLGEASTLNTDRREERKPAPFVPEEKAMQDPFLSMKKGLGSAFMSPDHSDNYIVDLGQNIGPLEYTQTRHVNLRSDHMDQLWKIYTEMYLAEDYMGRSPS